MLRRSRVCCPFLVFCLVSVLLLASLRSTAHALSLAEQRRRSLRINMISPSRRSFLSTGMLALTTLLAPSHVTAFSAARPQQQQVSPSATIDSVQAGINGAAASTSTVAYKPLSLEMEDFGVRVPVAMWYPAGSSYVEANQVDRWNNDHQKVSYDHRISVRKIGELLAGWEFIPEFMSKEFLLEPTLQTGRVVNGRNVPLPTNAPIVVLAHGYLGSRFDLSHLAEALAQQGFVCVSAEYPESLASSYPRVDGLDRSRITTAMLDKLTNEWGVQATSWGIVGHSLGTGTAMTTGDASWTRVCIAGFPRTRDGASIPGSVLFLTSMNDGAVSLSRFGGKSAIPADYEQLEEATLGSLTTLPRRAALVFDRPDAPNHISFLADGVNTAMIDLLSPLLPVAQFMSIPVLDFDKYKVSRDSDATAQVVIPLVTNYLKEHMKQ